MYVIGSVFSYPVPSAAPDSVFARQGEVVGELFVQWKPPPCQERNGLIVNYTVTAHSSAGQVSVTTSSNLTSVILRQLRALEEYMVQVSAATTAGSGPLSLSFTAKTSQFGEKMPFFYSPIILF